MIREVGERPPGVTIERDVARAVRVVMLGGRRLFEMRDHDVMAADEIVIDWNDLGRAAPPSITEQQPAA